MFEGYDDLLSVAEACELLKIGKNKMYTLLHSGELKGYRSGKIWRISKLAIEEYILRSSKLD